MPFNPHDRKDDDMSGLGLNADLLKAAHQTPPFWKLNHTPHSVPSPDDIEAQSRHAKIAGSAVAQLSRVDG
ncbi:MAG TPA: hypothetical protein VMH84_09325 [Xanthobacteraceae bacterium]|nr:hypothetical protein [Xanthobacteraceae bacterium]